jgi:hypothetical protein
VHRILRTAFLLTMITMLAACGNGSQSGIGRACTSIGVRVGIGLDVKAPFAAKVGKVKLSACWAESCTTPVVELYQSSRSAGTTCTGTGPDAVCGTSAVPTEDKNGFADLPQLPAGPVTVTLTMLDTTGGTLSEQNLVITPKTVFPNGPECGGGMPQAGLIVSSDGTVSERI